MNCMSVENITKSFGEKVLFENINFGIEKGQKAALVAANGTGKTTLLNIISGKDTPDNGAVAFNKEISFEILEQDPDFLDNETIRDYLFRGDNQMLKAVVTYETVLDSYEQDPSEENLEALNDATTQMEMLKAWDYESKLKEVITKLRVPKLDQQVKTLSGGQKKRVALSRVLIAEPDFLILDEPTNHLDLDMIEWLEQFLARQNLTLLLVTHDRYFLDRICNEIIEIENQKLFRHKGNYSAYLANKAEREEQLQRETDKAKNLMRKELDWIRRMPKARGTKAKYRVDAFEGIKEKASANTDSKSMEVEVNMSRMGKKVMEIYDLQKSFGDFPIVKDFSYVFKRRERIGIVGPNGVGKSTFLNMLTGKIKPDSGKIDHGETIVFGYYTQSGIQLEEEKKVIEVVSDIAEVIEQADGSKITASQMLQKFLFPPKQQYDFVSKLSGGERRRLYLLTVLMKNPNFLILDEPTNDLDLLTLNVLEDFLLNFPGCIIIVSHDRYFMDKLTDHLFIFEGDGVITDFNGRYLDYRAYIDDKEREEQRALKEQKDKEKAQKLEAENAAAAKKSNAPKLSFKEQKEYEQLEAEIEKLETEKTEVNKKLSSGEITDHADLQELSEKVGQLIELIDEKTMRWLELSEKS
ncbi:ABC-F family ATP-binding cassette domain-containing protein [Chondrinema litorale]|nr:ABC-F family ATP-binding cassette domain-containing protein [Chondrinema litorale]UZR93753.1 ABC-F family ATP-binding cassette domain-containing protein [Chondrinema litorale]